MKKVILCLAFIASAYATVPPEMQGTWRKTHTILHTSNRLTPVPSNLDWQLQLDSDSGNLKVTTTDGEWCEIDFKINLVRINRTDWAQEIQNERLYNGSHSSCQLMTEFQSLARYRQTIRKSRDAFYQLANKEIKLNGSIWQP